MEKETYSHIGMDVEEKMYELETKKKITRLSL